MNLTMRDFSRKDVILVKRIATLLILSILLLVGCNSNSKEKSPNGTSEAVSGTLQFYTSQPDTDATELVQQFNKKYPDVDVKIFRSGTEEVIGKVLAENEAGTVQADVLLVADSVTFESLKEQQLLESYKSPEFEHIPTEFVDEDAMYAGTKVMATVLAVNTDKVKDVPTSWLDVTNEQFKGETIMPSPLYSGAAAYNVGVFTRQDHIGWDFYNKLKDNKASVVQGNGAALQAVAGAEKSVAMVVDFIVTRAIQDGSNLKLVYPSEGVPVITEPIGLLKDARNKDAATAFIDFVLSEEGQQIAATLGYTPIRKGVSAPEGLKSIDELQILSASLEELIEAREEDKRQFKQIFGE